MIDILKAADGSDTLKISGIQIHSAYSPQKEVNRYLSSMDFSNRSTVIICGETLGYLKKYFEMNHPDITVLSILYDPCFCRFFSDNEQIWHFHSDISLSAFLQKHISVLNTIGLEIVTWPASDRAFSDISIQNPFYSKSVSPGIFRVNFYYQTIRQFMAP